MEGAKERLKLFKMDLMDYQSIQDAIDGCSGVFHLAMPNTIDAVEDPQVSSMTTILMFFMVSNTSTYLGFVF